MSPLILTTKRGKLSFPRVSGDEPEGGCVFHGQLGFSPRERG